MKDERNYLRRLPEEHVQGDCIVCGAEVSVKLTGHEFVYNPEAGAFRHVHAPCREGVPIATPDIEAKGGGR